MADDDREEAVPAASLDRCQGEYIAGRGRTGNSSSVPGNGRSTNHRELREVLLEGRSLRLAQEEAVLVEAVRRQVRRAGVPRGARRRRRVAAVTQRASL